FAAALTFSAALHDFDRVATGGMDIETPLRPVIDLGPEAEAVFLIFWLVAHLLRPSGRSCGGENDIAIDALADLATVRSGDDGAFVAGVGRGALRCGHQLDASHKNRRSIR